MTEAEGGIHPGLAQRQLVLKAKPALQKKIYTYIVLPLSVREEDSVSFLQERAKPVPAQGRGQQSHGRSGERRKNMNRPPV